MGGIFGVKGEAEPNAFSPMWDTVPPSSPNLEMNLLFVSGCPCSM